MSPTDKQIEAAAKAMYDEHRQASGYSSWPVWDDLPRDSPHSAHFTWLKMAEAALTAAALAHPAEGEEVERLRGAIAAIQRATVAGKVCDDVAWFDGITTLFDFCEQILNPPPGSTSRPAQAEEGWKPIESAPKDGTDILTWSANGQRVARWEAGGFVEGWFIPLFATGGGGTVAQRVTHWRPIEPPRDAEVNVIKQPEETSR